MEPTSGNVFTYERAKAEYEKLGKLESFSIKFVAIIAGIFGLYETAFTWMVQKFIDPNSQAGQTANKVNTVVNKEPSIQAAPRDELSKKNFEPYFHDIYEARSDEILLDKEPGSFLVRNSKDPVWRSDGGFTISAVMYDTGRNRKIIKNKRFIPISNGEYEDSQGTNYRSFTKLVESVRGDIHKGVYSPPQKLL